MCYWLLKQSKAVLPHRAVLQLTHAFLERQGNLMKQKYHAKQTFSSGFMQVNEINSINAF